MEIIERRESNKLIAEFMGAKYVEGWSSESNDPIYHFDTKPSFHPDHWHTFDFQINHMLYDSSWDWLMPSCKKYINLYPEKVKKLKEKIGNCEIKPVYKELIFLLKN